MAALKPDSVIRIPTSLTNGFFVLWYKFLRPLIDLTEREIQVMAYLAQNRYELSKKVTDMELLDKLSLNDEVKRGIRENLNISYAYLQTVFSKLRKVGILVDDKINLKYLPNIKEDANGFQLMLYFDFDKIPEVQKL